MANTVLTINPPVADADLTSRGSSFLWAIFAIMFASGLGVIAWTLSTVQGTSCALCAVDGKFADDPFSRR